MDTILISILPVLPLVLLIAFGIWMRAGRSQQAARMAERFDIRKQDEMEKEIQRKSLIASYYAMLCILGAYMLYKAWIEHAGIGNVAFAAIFAAALTKGVATFVLRWRSTAGGSLPCSCTMSRPNLATCAAMYRGVASTNTPAISTPAAMLGRFARHGVRPATAVSLQT